MIIYWLNSACFWKYILTIIWPKWQLFDVASYFVEIEVGADGLSFNVL